MCTKYNYFPALMDQTHFIHKQMVGGCSLLYCGIFSLGLWLIIVSYCDRCSMVLVKSRGK